MYMPHCARHPRSTPIRIRERASDEGCVTGTPGCQFATQKLNTAHRQRCASEGSSRRESGHSSRSGASRVTSHTTERQMWPERSLLCRKALRDERPLCRLLQRRQLVERTAQTEPEHAGAAQIRERAKGGGLLGKRWASCRDHTKRGTERFNAHRVDFAEELEGEMGTSRIDPPRSQPRTTRADLRQLNRLSRLCADLDRHEESPALLQRPSPTIVTP